MHQPTILRNIRHLLLGDEMILVNLLVHFDLLLRRLPHSSPHSEDLLLLPLHIIIDF